MKRINTTSQLKDAIRELETRNIRNGERLKARFSQAREDLRPANLVKSTVRHIFNAGSVKNVLKGNLLQIATGMAATFLVKKFFTRK